MECGPFYNEYNPFAEGEFKPYSGEGDDFSWDWNEAPNDYYEEYQGP